MARINEWKAFFPYLYFTVLESAKFIPYLFYTVEISSKTNTMLGALVTVNIF